MAKLKTSGYELLEPGRYVLEVASAEPVDEYGPQLKVAMRVVQGEHKGHTFYDYPTRADDGSIRVGTKAWEIFEACLNRRLSPSEELDTSDIVGKKLAAQVVVKKGGKGNRTEFGTINPAP